MLLMLVLVFISGKRNGVFDLNVNVSADFDVNDRVFGCAKNAAVEMGCQSTRMQQHVRISK